MYLLKQWLCYNVASRRQYQVLLGKLNCIAACVRQGWIFVSSIIAHLKILPKTGSYSIPNSVCKDLMWWHEFLPEYNGVSIMAIEEWSKPDEVFATDDCLSGCGGWNQNRQFFHKSFPEFIIKTKPTHQLFRALYSNSSMQKYGAISG